MVQSGNYRSTSSKRQTVKPAGFILLCLLPLLLWSCPPPEEGIEPPSCDIVFVIDESSSVNGTEYLELKDFVTDMVNSLAINAGEVNAGLAFYSTDARTVQALSSDKAAILASISSVVQVSGGSNTGEGFYQAQEILAAPVAGRMPDSRIVVLVTDGPADLPVDAATARTYANTASGIVRDIPTVVITVGIGGVIDVNDLMTWCSWVDGTPYYYLVPAFNNLVDIEPGILIRIASCMDH